MSYSRGGAACAALTMAIWLVACDKPVHGTPPPRGCVEVAAWATVVSVYCPPATDQNELGRWLSLVAQERSSSHRANQIHILVSRVEGAAPKNANEIDYEADTVLATMDWNRNTGFVEMKCRPAPRAALTDCTKLLPRRDSSR